MSDKIYSAENNRNPRFLAIFLITTVIGVRVITAASCRASQELEIIHEAQTMHNMVDALLGKKRIEQLIQGEVKPDIQHERHGLYFYVLSGKQVTPLHEEAGLIQSLFADRELQPLTDQGNGGYIDVQGRILTWTILPASTTIQDKLLVMHEFTGHGNAALAYVYKQRIIIPALFYIWLMIWVSLIFNHLTRRIRQQRDQLRHMALHDDLTGLPNRNLMQDRLLKLIEISKREKKKFAFSIIDLDGFKAVNDQYGHAYGDELLKKTAQRINKVLRESDTAARLGGDEFTSILSYIDENEW